MSQWLKFEAKFNPQSIDMQIEQIKAAVASGVRVAAQAGAQVLYDEVKLRAGRVGDQGFSKGLLAKSIYQKYVKELSTEGHRATYHVSWNKGKGTATPRAFHGQLIEYGWTQRYATYMDSQGNWHTAVKPENKGKRPPWQGSGKNGGNKRPTLEQTDAWFVPRKGGPIRHAPKSFLRAAYEAKFVEAMKAAGIAMNDHILNSMV